MKAFLTKLGAVTKILWKWICRLIKIMWTLAAIIVIAVTIILVEPTCDDTIISHNISERFDVYKRTKIGRYYIYDNVTGEKIVKWISSIDREFGTDSLIRFSRKDLWGQNEQFGYIDARTGNVVIEPQFCYADKFYEGSAWVSGESGVCRIDTTGKIILQIDGHIVDSKKIKVHHGTAVVKVSVDKCGIISNTGEWVLEPEYSSIERIDDNVYIIVTERCKHGVWCASNGWIFEPIYENIVSNFSDTALEITNKGLCWEADYEGKTTKSLVYDYSEQLFYHPAGSCGESVATEYFKFRIDGKGYGVFNIRTKEIVFPAIYENIDMMDKDIFEVTTKDFQTFLVDKKGVPLPIKTE